MDLIGAVSQFKFTRHSNAVAAGTSVITPSASIDMAGFRGCVFIVEFGAITATAVTSAEIHSSSDDGAVDTFAIITGTNITIADDQDNKILVLEVVNPSERYVKCVVNRGTANAVLEGITAFQWGGRIASPTQPSSVADRVASFRGQIIDF